jgi:hypothetical protein
LSQKLGSLEREINKIRFDQNSIFQGVVEGLLSLGADDIVQQKSCVGGIESSIDDHTEEDAHLRARRRMTRRQGVLLLQPRNNKHVSGGRDESKSGSYKSIKPVPSKPETPAYPDNNLTIGRRIKNHGQQQQTHPQITERPTDHGETALTAISLEQMTAAQAPVVTPPTPVAVTRSPAPPTTTPSSRATRIRTIRHHFAGHHHQHNTAGAKSSCDIPSLLSSGVSEHCDVAAVVAKAGITGAVYGPVNNLERNVDDDEADDNTYENDEEVINDDLVDPNYEYQRESEDIVQNLRSIAISTSDMPLSKIETEIAASTPLPSEYVPVSSGVVDAKPITVPVGPDYNPAPRVHEYKDSTPGPTVIYLQSICNVPNRLLSYGSIAKVPPQHPFTDYEIASTARNMAAIQQLGRNYVPLSKDVVTKIANPLLLGLTPEECAVIDHHGNQNQLSTTTTAAIPKIRRQLQHAVERQQQRAAENLNRCKQKGLQLLSICKQFKEDQIELERKAMQHLRNKKFLRPRHLTYRIARVFGEGDVKVPRGSQCTTSNGDRHFGDHGGTNGGDRQKPLMHPTNNLPDSSNRPSIFLTDMSRCVVNTDDIGGCPASPRTDNMTTQFAAEMQKHDKHSSNAVHSLDRAGFDYFTKLLGQVPTVILQHLLL